MSFRVILILCIFHHSLFSQILFEDITVNDGLSQSAVYDITQDTLGYLWISTRDGLNKYDGHDFIIYKNVRGDSTSIADNLTYSIISDNEGGVWAASNKGLSHYILIEDHFENFLFNGYLDDPHSLMLQGDSLVLSTRKGLLFFNIRTKEWSEHPFFNSHRVFKTLLIANGKLLTATNKGLFSIKDKNVVQVEPELLTECNGLMQNEEDIFVATANELIMLDSNLNIQKRVKHKILNPNYKEASIIIDDEDRFWLASEKLAVFNKNLELLNVLESNSLNSNSLLFNQINTLYVSSDKSIWIGTNGGGINRYNKYDITIKSINNRAFDNNTLSNKNVSSIYRKGDSLFVGTIDYIDVFDVSVIPAKKIYTYDLTEYEVGSITKITELGSNELVIGTSLAGVFRLGDMFSFNVDYNCYDLKPINDSLLLIAQSGREFIKYNLRTRQSYNLIDPKKRIYTTNILFEDSITWAATSKGVLKFDRRFNLEGVYNSDEIETYKCLFRSSEGVLWAGSLNNGLFIFDDNLDSLVQFEKNDLITSGTIYGILEDNNQNLWFSTNSGVFCYINESEDIINFTHEHGLQSNEFNTGAYYKDKEGALYFGGVNGLSYFRPSELLNIPFSSKVFVTDIWVDQKKLKRANWYDGKIVIDPDQNTIKIDFTSVLFNLGSTKQYRYRFSKDNQFTEIGSQSSVYFTNLESGEYTLEINASNAFGRWQSDTYSLDLIVEPPFWRKTWFVVLTTFSFIILGVFIYLIRIKRLRLRNLELKKQVDERTKKVVEQSEEIKSQNEVLAIKTRELTKLNNSLENIVSERTKDLQLSNEELAFQNQQLEHFNFITRHNLKGPLASLKGLMQLIDKETGQDVVIHLNESISKLEGTLNDLSEALELENENVIFQKISLKKILDVALAYFQSDIEKRGILVDLKEFEDANIIANPKHIEYIFHNLIKNAVMYSSHNKELSKIVIRSQVESEHIKITFVDNGIGINMKYANGKLFHLFQRFTDVGKGKGMALYIIKTQLASMNASIKIESKENEGTKVMLYFPKGGSKVSKHQ